MFNFSIDSSNEDKLAYGIYLKDNNSKNKFDLVVYDHSTANCIISDVTNNYSDYNQIQMNNIYKMKCGLQKGQYKALCMGNGYYRVYDRKNDKLSDEYRLDEIENKFKNLELQKFCIKYTNVKINEVCCEHVDGGWLLGKKCLEIENAGHNIIEVLSF